jgi:diacylglycerol kinase (ATP)
MRARAILSPNANERDLAPFRAAGAEIIAAEGLAPATTQMPADAVLVLGGDGTVQRHLADLVRAQAPLLVVPSGSGNDFARALGLRTRAEALRAWARFLRAGDNIRQIDVGVLHFAGEGARSTTSSTYFACAAGAGVDAEVARQANSLPGWLRGNGGYFLAAIPALLRFRAQHIRVTANGQDGKPVRTISEPAILAAAANAPCYGHGMRIAPQAELDDGQLEVCFVRHLGKLRLLRLFPKVYRGTHVGLPQVEYFQAASVRIESEWPLAVHADGELLGRTPVEVSVARRALRVIV